MDRKGRGSILIRGEGKEKGRDIQMKRIEWERNWNTWRGKRRRNGRKVEGNTRWGGGEGGEIKGTEGNEVEGEGTEWRGGKY